MRVETIYISEDGKHFLNEEECKKYEEQNYYNEFFKNYGFKIRFYDDCNELIKKEDLLKFNFDFLDYIYLEDNTLAEITHDFIERNIPSPFEEFGMVAGYFYWDRDDEKWKDFAEEYNDLIEKNKTGFDLKYILNLQKKGDEIKD